MSRSKTNWGTTKLHPNITSNNYNRNSGSARAPSPSGNVWTIWTNISTNTTSNIHIHTILEPNRRKTDKHNNTNSTTMLRML
ncbi:MAG: hypothetical protein RXR18_06035 [Nitrososphaeria archaeon]